MKIEIKNGRVIDPEARHRSRRRRCISPPARSRPSATAPPAWHANRVIDATGLDRLSRVGRSSARLREPGFEYKATLESEMQAAVAGGVTSLACPPDTDPPLDEPGLVEMLKHRARSLNLAHVYPIGALTVGLAGETITEMGELTEAGCIAFSQADVPLADTQVLLRAMQYAATFGYRVWLRPQDAHLAQGRRGARRRGGDAARSAGYPGRRAETIALATIFALVRDDRRARASGRLSTPRASRSCARPSATACRSPATSAIHHLHLCDIDIGWFDAQCHLMPPLRGTRDRDALRAGLADGTIDSICSDHTPVDDDAKQLPFAEAEPARPGWNCCCR